MKNKRYETRYFFFTSQLSEVLATVRTILGPERVYDFPVTETIYFTLGHSYGYIFPHGLRTRARRYIKEPTLSVVIDNSPFFS